MTDTNQAQHEVDDFFKGHPYGTGAFSERDTADSYVHHVVGEHAANANARELIKQLIKENMLDDSAIRMFDEENRKYLETHLGRYRNPFDWQNTAQVTKDRFSEDPKRYELWQSMIAVARGFLHSLSPQQLQQIGQAQEGQRIFIVHGYPQSLLHVGEGPSQRAVVVSVGKEYEYIAIQIYLNKKLRETYLIDDSALTKVRSDGKRRQQRETIRVDNNSGDPERGLQLLGEIQLLLSFAQAGGYRTSPDGEDFGEEEKRAA